MKKETRRHVISLTDLTDQELSSLLFRGVAFSNGEASPEQLLKGLIIGIYFRKTSTRTRTAFSSAALRMGAQIISYGPNDLQENTGESIDDSTQVLSRMLDGFVARTAGSTQEMRCFASQNRMAVINAMSSAEHPTQALTDLTTMLQKFGDLSGLRVLYLGEGNNTATALTLSLPRFSGTELFLCTPNGYGLTTGTLELSQKYGQKCGSRVVECHDTKFLPDEVDVVYTTRWETTGTEKSDLNWRSIFNPFSVSQRMMDKYPNALFMHDLPAHRGEEVDGSVIDGPQSIVFDQSENKLYNAMAVLEWCLNSQ